MYYSSSDVCVGFVFKLIFPTSTLHLYYVYRRVDFSTQNWPLNFPHFITKALVLCAKSIVERHSYHIGLLCVFFTFITAWWFCFRYSHAGGLQHVADWTLLLVLQQFKIKDIGQELALVFEIFSPQHRPSAWVQNLELFPTDKQVDWINICSM